VAFFRKAGLVVQVFWGVYMLGPDIREVQERSFESSRVLRRPHVLQEGRGGLLSQGRPSWRTRGTDTSPVRARTCYDGTVRLGSDWNYGKRI
jgi:hypothetical protein